MSRKPSKNPFGLSLGVSLSKGLGVGMTLIEGVSRSSGSVCKNSSKLGSDLLRFGYTFGGGSRPVRKLFNDPSHQV